MAAGRLTLRRAVGNSGSIVRVTSHTRLIQFDGEPNTLFGAGNDSIRTSHGVPVNLRRPSGKRPFSYSSKTRRQPR